MQSEKTPLQFKRMTKDDIPELTEIMTRTFDDDAQTFLGEESGGPPGYNTGEFLRKYAFEEGGLGWTIFADDKKVGAFIIFITPENDHWLGNIFIDPNYQNHQIGTRTWDFIEKTYSNARNWYLETPTWATRNHHFYEKLGFVRIKAQGDDTLYKKEMS